MKRRNYYIFNSLMRPVLLTPKPDKGIIRIENNTPVSFVITDAKINKMLVN